MPAGSQLSHLLCSKPSEASVVISTSQLKKPDLEEPHLAWFTQALRGMDRLSFEALDAAEETGSPARRPLLSRVLSLQVGSYFGGELCGIDVNQDGEAELLLIGAPLFYGEQRGGRVFIYERKQVRTGPWS